MVLSTNWSRSHSIIWLICFSLADPKASKVNLRGAAMDLSSDPRCFDLTSAAGFVSLGCGVCGVALFSVNIVLISHLSTGFGLLLDPGPTIHKSLTHILSHERFNFERAPNFTMACVTNHPGLHWTKYFALERMLYCCWHHAVNHSVWCILV